MFRRRRDLLEKHVQALMRKGQLSPVQREACQVVLKDKRGLGLLAKEVDAFADDNSVSMLLKPLIEEADGPPKERPLLKWLWEHREEILAFILKIAGLFLK